jgi:hypothetical protein
LQVLKSISKQEKFYFKKKDPLHVAFDFLFFRNIAPEGGGNVPEYEGKREMGNSGTAENQPKTSYLSYFYSFNNPRESISF